jgi:hypothetical protein
MTGRLAMLALAGAVCACDAPPPAAAPVQPPAPQEPEVKLSRQQLHERSGKCADKAREVFRRELPESAANTAEFAYHYNTKLDTCFGLLTVTHRETLSRKLLDVNENETYGEYLGLAAGESPPGAAPAVCRIESLYCASGREWEVLAEPYMRN